MLNECRKTLVNKILNINWSNRAWLKNLRWYFKKKKNSYFTTVMNYKILEGRISFVIVQLLIWSFSSFSGTWTLFRDVFVGIDPDLDAQVEFGAFQQLRSNYKKTSCLIFFIWQDNIKLPQIKRYANLR